MSRLEQLIIPTSLSRLREAFSEDAMRASMSATLDDYCPTAQPLTAGVNASFYGADGPLSPVQRETCMIGLLTVSGVPLSLGIHVYWGMMTGLSVQQVSHLVALGACYSGLPKLGTGLLAVEKTLGILDDLARNEELSPTQVLAGLVRGFANERG